MDENKKNTLTEALADVSGPETETEAAAESDSDDMLERFLSREQEEKKPARSHKILVPVIIAAVIVVGLVLALILLRGHPAANDDESLDPAEVSLNVGEDGVHEAAVAVDEDGNILKNGSGSLLSYVPADIVQIDVENLDGSFTVKSETPEGEATVYTLVGFEDYDLQEGVADEIANHSAAISFDKVISADGKLADFGLAEPRATVTIHFTDETTAILRVGDNAAGEAGTYITFGSSNAVYLVESDAVNDYLFSVNDLISLTITETVEDSDNAAFSTLTISGTHFDAPITIEPNTDEAIDAAYLVTSPRRMFANATEAYDIAGNIRGLYAESVVCVNPSDNQMASYGLSDPYASIKATYPDAEITLHASAPGENGSVFLYNPDTNVVYSIQLAAVCWAKTGVDLLIPENPLIVNTQYLSGVHFTSGDTDFTLNVSTTSETVTDDDGAEQEVYTTTADYNGTALTEQNFSIFLQNLNAIKNQGLSDSSGKTPIMRVTYSYSSDRADDTLTVYDGDSTYLLELNGEIIGTTGKAYINSLTEGAAALIKGEDIPSL